MTGSRVGIFDRSPSIRALLRRMIENSEGLICHQSGPLSDLSETGADLGRFDVLVLGLSGDQEKAWSAIAALVSQAGSPVLILSPPGYLDVIPKKYPEGCQVMEKPRDPQGWEAFGPEFVAVLQQMEEGKTGNMDTGPVFLGPPNSKLDLIAVGCSAGGPDATGELLKGVGKELASTRVVIVQHSGEGFESEYVLWLKGILPGFDVGVGRDGEELLPGQVRIAGHGAHLEITENFSLVLDWNGTPDHGHRPSVDRLFRSLARSNPLGTAGVLLSGMGIDGVEGMVRLNRAGGLTMVQDRESSAVFGMPRAALERGAASIVQPPSMLGSVLKRYLEGGGRR